MDKKAIQEERMKQYFLTAAKEIIRAEGIAAISTRNVADRAGYSYATLYNYFKDVRDLVFSCIADFMEECREFVRGESSGAAAGAASLAAITRAYAKFYVQYPGIYALMYTHKPVEITTDIPGIVSLGGFFDSLADESWRALGVDSAHPARRAHGLAVHGLLAHFLNRRMDLDYPALMKELDGVTTFCAEAE